MRPVFFCLCCLFFSAVSFAQGKVPLPPPAHHLVEVQLANGQQERQLLLLDLDIAGFRAREASTRLAEVIATDRDLRSLKASGLKFRVAIRNLEDHYEKDLAANSLGQPETLTPPLGQGGMGGHYTLAQMEAILDSFQQKHPTLCAKKVSIGKSLEGRDIWMVKISDNVVIPESEPKVLYDALHHAREPLSMETTLLFMDELLDGYGTDPEATFILNERQLYFVPCLNPDGYEYNRSTRPGGGGMWRKNRRTVGSTVYGVDLNRNYATGWSAPYGGSSSSPSSQTYRGTAAFSEPETAAIEAFAKAHKFVQVCSAHTYGDVLLRAWGYMRGEPANSAQYQILGSVMTAKNGIRHGAASALLYIASGTALDHHHAARGSFSWTPELGRSSEGGFWPSGQRIIDIARRHQHMFRQMALTAGPSLAIDKITVTEAAGGNGNGIVEPGESGEILVDVRNDGAAGMSSSPQLQLLAVSAGISINQGQASLPPPPRFGKTNNSSTLLRFTVPKSYPSLVVKLKLVLTGDGRRTENAFNVPLAPIRTVVMDDMEKDRGFVRASMGTATTGLWERSTPQQTSSGGKVIQPGQQHTPNGRSCWITDGRAGTSAGTYDVDSGYTDLLSPVLDLSHIPVAKLEFWRWYGESYEDDDFEVYLSADGGVKWTKIFASPTSTPAWTRFVYELPSPLTQKMRFRFRAKDLVASLVEAGVDDFQITGIAPDGSVTLLSSGLLGSTLQVGLNGQPGAAAIPIVSIKAGTNISIPGIGGTLQLDPASAVLAGVYPLGSGGFLGRDFPIPTIPILKGVTFYWQMLHLAGPQALFGNMQAVTLR